MAKMTKEQAVEMLKNRKVYVDGNSAEIQEKLFEIGWKWNSCGNVASFTECPFLYINENFTLSADLYMITFLKDKKTEI